MAISLQTDVNSSSNDSMSQVVNEPSYWKLPYQSTQFKKAPTVTVSMTSPINYKQTVVVFMRTSLLLCCLLLLCS